jgi:signal transduction histidine kinase
MKIKTKLWITGIISLGIMVAAAAVIHLAACRVDKMNQEERFANHIVEKVVELRTLTFDYLLHRTERTRQQWWAAYDDIGRFLVANQSHATAEAGHIRDIIARYDLIDDAFLRLLQNQERKEIHREKAALHQEVENRLVSQLLQETQGIVSQVFQLAEHISQQVQTTQRRAALLQMGALLLVGLMVGINSWLIVRAIAQPIFQLQKGAEIIGAGHLDYRLGSTAPDEIGELSRAFDAMTANLQQTTVSRDELGREVAERQKVEAKLQQAIRELERSNADLQAFAYIASHDLQEPLRMVSSYVGLLQSRYQEQLDADAHDFIAFAVDGATRMQRLINDLLAYSRVGSRDKPLAPTDSESVFTLALANLQAAIQENGAVITHDPLPTVTADEAHLVQVFQNLLGNALKFHGQGPPRIHVNAAIQGDEWVFAVRDHGIGIDPQYHQRIFAIFQRLHGRNEYPGTGIGLALCKRIVEHHGGRIWVESELNQGATFYFTIPVKGATDLRSEGS